MDGTCQPPVQDIPVEDAIRHKEFDNRKKINDIALLRLKTAAVINKKNVNTICLPTTEESQIDHIQKEFQEKMLITGESSCQLRCRLNIFVSHLPLRMGSSRKRTTI